MAKQRMIVTDDQLLIDMDLLFNAVREAQGDWEKVEEDIKKHYKQMKIWIKNSVPLNKRYSLEVALEV